jgi:hypothetical protein
MSIKFYDTNLSYYLGVQIGRRLLCVDWWYARKMRRCWWRPLEWSWHIVYGRSA